MLYQNQINGPDMNDVFENLVQRVLETETFGVCGQPIVLNFVTSSGKEKADRFNFSIPYAGHRLDWTVLFNSSCPEMGPDFEFHDDTFLADPDVDTIEKYIPSLAEWHSMQPDSLLKVLGELIICYKQHQLNLLTRNEQRLHTEYAMLIENAEVSYNDVEMILLPDADSPNEARFVIRLDMDFSCLPGRNNVTSNDAAMLVITFYQPNWSRRTPQLFLTTNLEQTLENSGSSQLCIPALARDKPVMDYITEVKKIISDKINAVVENYEKKHNFVGTLLYHARHNVIEYDTINLTRITILIEHKDFHFLVHFLLTPGFPSKPPFVLLQSIHHMNDKNELTQMPLQNYPYSPRWPSSRMIKTILNKSIPAEFEKFKSICIATVKNGG